MRGKAGKAAAPAARRRNSLRWPSFMVPSEAVLQPDVSTDCRCYEGVGDELFGHSQAGAIAHLRHEEKLNEGILDRVIMSRVPNAGGMGVAVSMSPGGRVNKGGTRAERSASSPFGYMQRS